MATMKAMATAIAVRASVCTGIVFFEGVQDPIVDADGTIL